MVQGGSDTDAMDTEGEEQGNGASRASTSVTVLPKVCLKGLSHKNYRYIVRKLSLKGLSGDLLIKGTVSRKLTPMLRYINR